MKRRQRVARKDEAAAPVVQPRLVLGPTDDPFEREAEQVASGMEKGSAARPTLAWRPTVGSATVDPGVEKGIYRAQTGGLPLPQSVRRPLEQSLGTDFGGVRIHTGGEADSLNRALAARAFTTGQHIFFRRGEYRPGSAAGRHLLAHELTHVVQQGAAPVAQTLQRQNGTRRGGAGAGVPSGSWVPASGFFLSHVGAAWFWDSSELRAVAQILDDYRASEDSWDAWSRLRAVLTAIETWLEKKGTDRTVKNTGHTQIEYVMTGVLPALARDLEALEKAPGTPDDPGWREDYGRIASTAASKAGVSAERKGELETGATFFLDQESEAEEEERDRLTLTRGKATFYLGDQELALHFTGVSYEYSKDLKIPSSDGKDTKLVDFKFGFPLFPPFYVEGGLLITGGANVTLKGVFQATGGEEQKASFQGNAEFEAALSGAASVGAGAGLVFGPLELAAVSAQVQAAIGGETKGNLDASIELPQEQPALQLTLNFEGAKIAGSVSFALEATLFSILKRQYQLELKRRTFAELQPTEKKWKVPLGQRKGFPNIAVDAMQLGEATNKGQMLSRLIGDLLDTDVMKEYVTISERLEKARGREKEELLAETRVSEALAEATSQMRAANALEVLKERSMRKGFVPLSDAPLVVLELEEVYRGPFEEMMGKLEAAFDARGKKLAKRMKDNPEEVLWVLRGQRPE